MTTASTVTPPPLPVRAGPPPMHAPAPRVWTVAEFHELGERGALDGRGAMLINGVIVEEGPMNPPHRLALELTIAALQQGFGTGWRVCGQMPLVLGLTTDPQPDVAVIPGSIRGATGHPATASLVVEISDTSFRYDTTDKLALYATAGIIDYWVLDVNGRRLHVFRDPAGDAYATHLTLGESDSVAPLASPAAAVRVADLLP